MKKKLGTMDKILVIIAMLILVFTVVMIILYIKTGGIPDTLCTCVFGICGGECGAMAWIKTTKERKTDRKYELVDRKYNEKS